MQSSQSQLSYIPAVPQLFLKNAKLSSGTDFAQSYGSAVTFVFKESASGVQPVGRGAENQKSKSRLFHKSKVVGDLKIGCFGFMQLFSQTKPRSPRALRKSGKSPGITGSLNKKLEFGPGA